MLAVHLPLLAPLCSILHTELSSFQIPYLLHLCWVDSCHSLTFLIPYLFHNTKPHTFNYASHTCDSTYLHRCVRRTSSKRTRSRSHARTRFRVSHIRAHSHHHPQPHSIRSITSAFPSSSPHPIHVISSHPHPCRHCGHPHPITHIVHPNHIPKHIAHIYHNTLIITHTHTTSYHNGFIFVHHSFNTSHLSHLGWTFPRHNLVRIRLSSFSYTSTSSYTTFHV